jgi:RNA polymerase sigma-70 factor (ECF subfamily)
MAAESSKRRREEIREDLALVRRCRNGDERARTQLVRRYMDQVRMTLFRIVGPNQDMADLIQNALIEVMRSLKHYRGDALLRTWIDRVCANVAYQHLRRKRGPTMVPLELVPDPTDRANAPRDGADAELEGRRMVEKMTGLLDGISPKKRIALLLHAVLGYSVKEVAAMTESRVSTTKSRILYARRELLKAARRDPALGEWLARTVE